MRFRSTGCRLQKEMKFGYSSKKNDQYILKLIKSNKYIIDSNKGTIFSVQKKRMIGSYDFYGYLVMGIILYKKLRQLKIHRIIWIAKNGVPPAGLVVDHINRKRDDNRIVNLRLFNAIENGQNNKNVKLTKKIAEKIREEYAQENTSYRKLGRKYHVSYGPILQIIKQKIWK